MKYFIKKFGCQYNEWEAARVDYLLQKLGYELSEEKDTEVLFIVACAVRQTGMDRVYGKIKNSKGKKIVVTGCVLKSDQKKLEIKNVYYWDFEKPEQLKEILEIKDEVVIANLIKAGNDQSPCLPIMIGCNNFCTYCAVPYTRGRETSRDFEEVVADFKALVARGYKKITLLGQNVNSYKSGLQDLKAKTGSKYESDFAILLETLNNIEGDFKIEFTSNHPKDMKDDVIEAIRDLEKVEKIIHLPIQAGSNRILKLMNRPYTREQYLELAAKIKMMIPDVKITTDVIVGFPGETEEEFEETVDIFNKVGYYISYTNKYSPREGTAAFQFGDPIPWSEKQRRWRILNDIANKK